MPILFPTPDMNLEQTFGAYMLAPYVIPSEVTTANPTYITEFRFEAFKRLWVDYIFKRGVSYVFWELERGFQDPGPYEFQLQGSHSGTPRGDDWFDIGDPTISFFAADDSGYLQQRMFGKSTTLYYRIVLTTILGKYLSPIISTAELFNKHDWLIVREILRQEQLAHRIFSSEKGYLLKARRYGPVCTTCKDRSVTNLFPDTIANTNCGECYGTGFVSGYYPPTEYYGLLQPKTTRERRELETTGTTKEDVSQARFLASLPMIQGDTWVSQGSDRRYYVHSIREAALWKSVPIVYSVELRLAPFTDAVYDVSIVGM
jgi:hypothetical protein